MSTAVHSVQVVGGEQGPHNKEAAAAGFMVSTTTRGGCLFYSEDYLASEQICVHLCLGIVLRR
jgi:hypothetical protein